MKRKLSKLTGFSVILLSILCLAACGSEPAEEPSSQNTPSEQPQPASEASKTQDETDSSEDETSADPTEPSGEQTSDIIEKITIATDETGIYTTVIILSDKAADKGVVEMVYGGVKGSPQENSVVNTFLIEYYKDAAGKFEIQTFYDGDAYQTLHQQDRVKVNNTFSASVRAGNITVFYTPDGGEKIEIYKKDY